MLTSSTQNSTSASSSLQVAYTMTELCLLLLPEFFYTIFYALQMSCQLESQLLLCQYATHIVTQFDLANNVSLNRDHLCSTKRIITTIHTLWTELLNEMQTVLSIQLIYNNMLSFSSLNLHENINRNDLSNIEEKEELFSAWKIFILTFVKLLIVPLVGCPIIYYYRTAGILNDDVMIFLYMFMMAAPNAINIIVVCSVKRCWLKNISVIMVVSYVCSVVTLTFSITLFLYILT